MTTESKDTNKKDQEKDTYTVCMEIAAAESMPELGYEPPKSSK